jgi:hypothetical protein
VKIRRYAYLVVVLAVVVLLSRGYKGFDRTEVTFPGNPISEDVIITDMKDLSDNRLPVQPVLGGHFFATAVGFEAGFSGKKDSRFWVAMEDGHVGYVLTYTIMEEPDRKLVYKVTQVKEGSQMPSDAAQKWQTDGKGKLQKVVLK